MKLAFYKNCTLGVIDDGNIMDVSTIVSDLTPCNPQALLETVIRNWDTYGARIADATQGQGGVSLDSVILCPPVPRPGQLVCLAGN